MNIENFGKGEFSKLKTKFRHFQSHKRTITLRANLENLGISTLIRTYRTI